MLNKDMPLSNQSLDNMVLEMDSQFRLNFQDLIKESKLYAHKCQFLCYQNKQTLLDAENCARNCYKPILYSKKNISTLLENTKENLEKCKFTAQTVNKDELGAKKEIIKCLNKYKIELEGLKDEAEYIYKGYMKNFESLIKEVEGNTTNSSANTKI